MHQFPLYSSAAQSRAAKKDDSHVLSVKRGCSQCASLCVDVLCLCCGGCLCCGAHNVSIRSILRFDEAQNEELAHHFLLSELTIEERAALVDARENGCASTRSEAFSDGIGVRTEAISGTWVAIPIPEGTTSGNLANSVFTDSGSSSWMCNSGSPESPTDFVVQFHFQGAYFNRNSLELQGQNWWGSCYLGSSNASRVYDDDDVRTCIGYWTTILCGGTPPITSDIAIGL